jgi:hypothetical protein
MNKHLSYLVTNEKKEKKIDKSILLRKYLEKKRGSMRNEARRV